MDTFYYITGQGVCANEVSEFLTVCLKYRMAVSLPLEFSL